MMDQIRREVSSGNIDRVVDDPRTYGRLAVSRSDG